MTDIITQASQMESLVAQMGEAFNAIAQPRSDFALANFVVGQHDTAPMAYLQCVLELQVKWNAVRRAMLDRKRIHLEIEGLSGSDDPFKQIELAKKRIDLEELEQALIGSFREFETLYAIWQSFPKRYTHAEIQAAQSEYWTHRLGRQAELDIAATGRIGQGNLDAMRQAGLKRLENPNGTATYFLQPPVREWSVAGAGAACLADGRDPGRRALPGHGADDRPPAGNQ